MGGSRTRGVSIDVRVGVGHPEGTAVRPLHRAGEHISTLDTVAVDETLDNVDEMLADKVGEEQGDDEEEEEGDQSTQSTSEGRKGRA